MTLRLRQISLHSHTATQYLNDIDHVLKPFWTIFFLYLKRILYHIIKVWKIKWNNKSEKIHILQIMCILCFIYTYVKNHSTWESSPQGVWYRFITPIPSSHSDFDICYSEWPWEHMHPAFALVRIWLGRQEKRF